MTDTCPSYEAGLLSFQEGWEDIQKEVMGFGQGRRARIWGSGLRAFALNPFAHSGTEHLTHSLHGGPMPEWGTPGLYLTAGDGRTRNPSQGTLDTWQSQACLQKAANTKSKPRGPGMRPRPLPKWGELCLHSRQYVRLHLCYGYMMHSVGCVCVRSE